MRSNLWILVAVLLAAFLRPSAAQIETHLVDLASTAGAAADGTVTITRDQYGRMILKDNGTGTTVSLADLATSGVSDHGLLSGLGDDDHNAGAWAYYTAGRLNTKMGNAVSTATTGASWNAGIAIPSDPAGYTTLGGHVTTNTIHWRRPPRVVTVGPNDGGKQAEWTTIQAAIDSITDASYSKRYVILVYPGTYSEYVTMNKDYISIVGLQRDSVILTHDATSSPTLRISTETPGEIRNMTIGGTLNSGAATISDGSTNGSRYVDCIIKAETGIAVTNTANGTNEFVSCTFQDTGSDGTQNYAVYATQAGNWKFRNCIFGPFNNRYQYAVFGDTGFYADAEFFDCEVTNRMEYSASRGAFLLTAGTTVRLWSMIFPSGAIIDPNSTNGTISHAFVRTDHWGHANGVTTSPLALSGPKFMSDVNIDGAGLLIGGTEVISAARNGTLNELDATTGTFDVLNMGTAAGSILAFTTATLTRLITVALRLNSYDFPTSPVTNYVLKFDGADIIWDADSTTGGDLNDLTDVDTATTAPSDNDVLKYYAGVWSPRADTGGAGGSDWHWSLGAGATTHSGLTSMRAATSGSLVQLAVSLDSTSHGVLTLGVSSAAATDAELTTLRNQAATSWGLTATIAWVNSTFATIAQWGLLKSSAETSIGLKLDTSTALTSWGLTATDAELAAQLRITRVGTGAASATVGTNADQLAIVPGTNMSADFSSSSGHTIITLNATGGGGANPATNPLVVQNITATTATGVNRFAGTVWADPTSSNTAAFVADGPSYLMGSTRFSSVGLFLNYDGPDADSSIWFYEDSSPTGERIYWDKTNDRFAVTDTFFASDGLYSGGINYTTNSGGDCWAAFDSTTGDDDWWLNLNNDFLTLSTNIGGGSRIDQIRYGPGETRFFCNTYTTGTVFIEGNNAAHTSATVALFVDGAGTIWGVATFGGAVNLTAMTGIHYHLNGAAADTQIASVYHAGSADGANFDWSETNNRFDFDHPVNATGLQIGGVHLGQTAYYGDVRAVDSDGLLTTRTLVEETVTTFAAQADVPRNLSVHVTIKDADDYNVDIIITGIGANGAIIEDTITVSNSGGPGIDTTQYTNYAFGTITQVQVREWSGWDDGDYEIGFYSRLGLPIFPLTSTADVYKVKKNNDNFSPSSVNATYGTVACTISEGDDFTFWYKLP